MEGKLSPSYHLKIRGRKIVFRKLGYSHCWAPRFAIGKDGMMRWLIVWKYAVFVSRKIPKKEKSRMTQKLTDVSPMPFGKHEGQAMEKVPASYLHWLWENGLYKEPENPVHQYIVDSMGALETEVPDKIWRQAGE